MKFQNFSVKRLFGRVAIGFALSMSGITIALFLVTKQTAVLLTGGALLLCALVGIFVLTQAFGKRLSQFTADLCQTKSCPRVSTCRGFLRNRFSILYSIGDRVRGLPFKEAVCSEKSRNSRPSS